MPAALRRTIELSLSICKQRGDWGIVRRAPAILHHHLGEQLGTVFEQARHESAQHGSIDMSALQRAMGSTHKGESTRTDESGR